jgi:8-oxo-dGTP pyrophosphatase MutT (NUDIX family)
MTPVHRRTVEQVRSAVAGFDARTPRERESRTRFLAELDRLPGPFEEEADPVHVTGSAIVAGPRGVLLHFHKRLHMWLQTGGHVEPGETPWQAALRESEEETGMALRFVAGEPVGGGDGMPPLVHLDVHPAAKGHTHLDLRYLLAPADPGAQPAPPPGESQQIRWFTWDDAVAAADPGLVDALLRLRP